MGVPRPQAERFVRSGQARRPTSRRLPILDRLRMTDSTGSPLCYNSDSTSDPKFCDPAPSPPVTILTTGAVWSQVLGWPGTASENLGFLEAFAPKRGRTGYHLPGLFTERLSQAWPWKTAAAITYRFRVRCLPTEAIGDAWRLRPDCPGYTSVTERPPRAARSDS